MASPEDRPERSRVGSLRWPLLPPEIVMLVEVPIDPIIRSSPTGTVRIASRRPSMIRFREQVMARCATARRPSLRLSVTLTMPNPEQSNYDDRSGAIGLYSNRVVAGAAGLTAVPAQPLLFSSAMSTGEALLSRCPGPASGCCCPKDRRPDDARKLSSRSPSKTARPRLQWPRCSS
jgi:hypothetical protein